MKKLISLLSCAALFVSAIPASAGASEEKFRYTDLFSMSDEELVSYVVSNTGSYFDFSHYFDAGFGSEDMTADEKYHTLWPDYNMYFDDGLYLHQTRENYYFMTKILNGTWDRRLTFFLSNDALLDDSVTAGSFGFPDDWEIEAYDGQDITTPLPKSARIYFIDVPLEVFEDYESYVRMEIAADYIVKDNLYGVSVYLSPAANKCFGGNIETSTIAGDVNLDNQVSIADAVLIMESIANPDIYGINGCGEVRMTRNGIKNGDFDKNGDGVTLNDALAIQEMLLSPKS